MRIRIGRILPKQLRPAVASALVGAALIAASGFAAIPHAAAETASAQTTANGERGSSITDNPASNTPVFNAGSPVHDGESFGPGDFVADAVQWQLRNESKQTVVVNIDNIINANAGDTDNAYNWFDEGLRSIVVPSDQDPYIKPVRSYSEDDDHWSRFVADYAAKLGQTPQSVWEWQKVTAFTPTDRTTAFGHRIWQIDPAGTVVTNSFATSPFSHSVCLNSNQSLNSYLSTGADYRLTNEFQGRQAIWYLQYSGRYAKPGECGIPLPELQANDDSATTDSGTDVAIDVLGNDVYDKNSSVGIKNVYAQDDSGTWTIIKLPNGKPGVQFIPKPGFVGDASATYTLYDDAGNPESTALITVHVLAAADAVPTPEPSPAGPIDRIVAALPKTGAGGQLALGAAGLALATSLVSGCVLVVRRLRGSPREHYTITTEGGPDA